MKNSIQWLVSAMCILGAITAESSQLIPIEVGKLESLSDVVLVGTVKAVERDANNTIPKEITDYDIVTVDVAFVLNPRRPSPAMGPHSPAGGAGPPPPSDDASSRVPNGRRIVARLCH